MNDTDDSQWKQVQIYQQMQDKVHEFAEKARADDLEGNKEYIQEMMKLWWDLSIQN